MNAWVLLSMMALAACDKGGEAPSGASSAPASASTAPSAPASVSSAAASAAASAEGDDEPADAAAGDVCGTAYEQVKLILEGFKRMPGNEADMAVPSKDEFLAGCHELPEDVQRCLLVAELIRDPKRAEDCKKKLDALPEDVKKKATELMQKAKAKGR